MAPNEEKKNKQTNNIYREDSFYRIETSFPKVRRTKKLLATDSSDTGRFYGTIELSSIFGDVKLLLLAKIHHIIGICAPLHRNVPLPCQTCSVR